MKVTGEPGYKETVDMLRQQRRFSDLDAFVMGRVGEVMRSAGDEYIRDLCKVGLQ